jgi:hypothetical protein
MNATIGAFLLISIIFYLGSFNSQKNAKAVSLTTPVSSRSLCRNMTAASGPRTLLFSQSRTAVIIDGAQVPKSFLVGTGLWGNIGTPLPLLDS